MAGKQQRKAGATGSAKAPSGRSPEADPGYNSANLVDFGPVLDAPAPESTPLLAAAEAEKAPAADKVPEADKGGGNPLFDTLTDNRLGGAMAFAGLAKGAAGVAATGLGGFLSPLGIIAGGQQINSAGQDDTTGDYELDMIEGSLAVAGGVVGAPGAIASLAGSGGAAGAGAQGLATAARFLGPIGAVLGAGLGGFALGRQFDGEGRNNANINADDGSAQNYSEWAGSEAAKVRAEEGDAAGLMALAGNTVVGAGMGFASTVGAEEWITETGQDTVDGANRAVDYVSEAVVDNVLQPLDDLIPKRPLSRKKPRIGDGFGEPGRSGGLTSNLSSQHHIPMK